MVDGQEVISTQAPPVTLPDLMPIEGRMFSWWYRTFRCSNGRHQPVWSTEGKEQAQTRYCWFCGKIMSTRGHEEADRPSTGGRVLVSFGFQIHAPECSVYRSHGNDVLCPELMAVDWGEADGKCECGLPAGHTRECAE